MLATLLFPIDGSSVPWNASSSYFWQPAHENEYYGPIYMTVPSSIVAFSIMMVIPDRM